MNSKNIPIEPRKRKKLPMSTDRRNRLEAGQEAYRAPVTSSATQQPGGKALSSKSVVAASFVSFCTS